MLEWFSYSGLPNAGRLGVVSGSVFFLYVLAAAAIAAWCAAAGWREAAADFHQAVAEASSASLGQQQEQQQQKVVGSVSLRFPIDATGNMGAYNETTLDERVLRETAFFELVRALHESARDHGVSFKTERRPEAGASGAVDETKPSHWWRFRYVIVPATRGNDNDDDDDAGPSLPLDYHMVGVDDATREFSRGIVRRAVIDADADILARRPHSAVTWKALLDVSEVHDGLSHTTFATEDAGRQWRLLMTQTPDQSVTLAVQRNGRTRPMFHARALRLQLRTEGSRVTDDALDRVTHGARFEFARGADLALDRAIRALPHVDAALVWKDLPRAGKHKQADGKPVPPGLHLERDTGVLLAGPSKRSLLPLAVVLRPFQGSKKRAETRTSRHHVERLQIRYRTHGAPHPRMGDLCPAATVPIRSLNLMLDDGSILAQDPVHPTKWIHKGKPLPPDCVLDLLILDRPATRGRGDTTTTDPAPPDATGPVVVGGTVDFTAFPSARAASRPALLGSAPEEHRRGAAWTDITTEEGHGQAPWRAPWATEEGRDAALGGAAAALVLFALGLRFLPSSPRPVSGAANVAAVTSATVALVLVVTDAYDSPGSPLDGFRPFEAALAGACVASAALCLVVFAATRGADPDAGFAAAASAALAAGCVAAWAALQSPVPVPGQLAATAAKHSLAAVAAAALVAAALEQRKLARRVAGNSRVGRTSRVEAGSAAGIALVFVATAVLVLVGQRTRADACEGGAAAAPRCLGDENGGSKVPEAVSDAPAATDAVVACAAAGLFFVLPVTVALLVARLTPNPLLAAGRRPQQPQQEEEQDSNGKRQQQIRVLDGRQPRGIWLAQHAAGVLLVVYVVWLSAGIPPARSAQHETTCAAMRERALRQRARLRLRARTLDATSAFAATEADLRSADCVVPMARVRRGVMGALALAATVAIAAPVRHKLPLQELTPGTAAVAAAAAGLVGGAAYAVAEYSGQAGLLVP